MTGAGGNVKERVSRSISELSTAAGRIHFIASDLQKKHTPFVQHKFFNFIGKEINEIVYQLLVYIGESKLGEYPREEIKMPSFELLKVIIKESAPSAASSGGR